MKSQILCAIGALIILQPYASAQAPGATRQSSLSINDHQKRIPLGSAMAGEREKQRLRDVAEEEAMDEIQALGFYAIVTVSDTDYIRLEQGIEWWAQRGEAYPFAGYKNGWAHLRLGDGYILIKPDSIILKSSKDSPLLVENYAQMLRQLRADVLLRKSAREVADLKYQLEELKRDQKRAAADKWWRDYQLSLQLDQLRPKNH